jgi:hypothetical protein
VRRLAGSVLSRNRTNNLCIFESFANALACFAARRAVLAFLKIDSKSVRGEHTSCGWGLTAGAAETTKHHLFQEPHTANDEPYHAYISANEVEEKEKEKGKM